MDPGAFVEDVPSLTINPSVCIFCFQTDVPEVEEGRVRDKEHEDVVQRQFFEVVQMYLERTGGSVARVVTTGSSFPFLPLAMELKLRSCSKCFRTIDSFCEVYQKIIRLEKKLDSKLDKLRDSMKGADEDSLRICDFKKWCLAERQNARKSMEFRRKFQNQCDIIKTKCFPKIRFERNKFEEANKPFPDDSVNLGLAEHGTLPIKKEYDETESINSPQVPSPFSDIPELQDGPSSAEPETTLSSSAEPPIKKMKLVKQLPSKPDDNISCEPSVDKSKQQKDRQSFECQRCKASFSTIRRLDKHVSSCLLSVIDGKNNENIKTEPGYFSDDNAVADAIEADWFAEQEHISDNDDVDDNQDRSDDDWIADDDGDESPSDDNNEDTEVSDNEWLSEDEDDWEGIGKKKEKNKTAKEQKPKSADSDSKPKRKRIRNTTSQNSKKRFECRLCHTDPPTGFGSVSVLQAHQKYLHTNGYTMINKTENSELLRLGEKSLKLKGIEPALRSCSECSKEFLLAEELENHQKYHGDVTCETCGVVMSNALDMVHHEIQHYKEGGQHYAERLKLSCGKCTHSTPIEGDLINHYLEYHMQKPALEVSCPICHQQFKYVDKVPIIHYINYHDLARLEDQSSTGIPCPQADCSAYFLTEDQIQQHYSSIHSSKKSDAIFEAAMSAVDRRAQAVALKTKQKAIRHRSRELIHKCDYCPKQYRADYELREHVWRSHADLKYGGPVGDIKLTEDGLTIDEFSIDKSCLCSICEKACSSEEQLERHKLHHGEFKCDFCDVTKTLATELAIHETVHKIGEKAGSFHCPRCPFSTMKRPDYIDHHLETHMNVPGDRKRCPICRKPVPSVVKKNAGKSGQKHWIVAHYMELHDKSGLDPDTMPKCTMCPGYFRTNVQLHNHTRELHGRQSVLVCVDCGMTFEKRDKLKRHRASKHKIDESSFQFGCSFPECGRRFERQIDVDYHESQAHNEKDIGIQICSDCGKQCMGTSQLKSHMRSHRRKEQRALAKPDPEPSMCDQCGKSFNEKRLLQAHKRRHRGPDHWKFVCEVCSRKCITRYKLNVHMRVHTKEKPCICQLCGSAYMNTHNLRHHIKTKHPEVKLE